MVWSWPVDVNYHEALGQRAARTHRWTSEASLHSAKLT